MHDLILANNLLYASLNRLPKSDNIKLLWNNLLDQKELLKEAIKIKKDRIINCDIVKADAITFCILLDYENVDKDIYNNLVSSIYHNKDIAREKILDYSFLLATLWNKDLKLTEEEKNFVLEEATTNILKHGKGIFDLRYLILNNNNWSLEEKKRIIYDLYPNCEEYDKTLENWELDIITDKSNYKDSIVSLLSIDDLYNYTYDYLLSFYHDKEITDNIWKKIEFCRQMHQIRPMQWEIDNEINSRLF